MTRRVDLLEQARHADHDRRLDLDEVSGDRLDALGKGHRHAARLEGEDDQPLQDVGERQEREVDIGRGRTR